jgi:hypothetical protein
MERGDRVEGRFNDIAWRLSVWMGKEVRVVKLISHWPRCRRNDFFWKICTGQLKPDTFFRDFS